MSYCSVKGGHSDRRSLATQGERPRSQQGEKRRVEFGVKQGNKEDQVKETTPNSAYWGGSRGQTEGNSKEQAEVEARMTKLHAGVNELNLMTRYWLVGGRRRRQRWIILRR